MTEWHQPDSERAQFRDTKTVIKLCTDDNARLLISAPRLIIILILCSKRNGWNGYEERSSMKQLTVIY